MNSYQAVGLTALPYSGKSLVADIFVAELGFAVVSHSSLIRAEAERRGAQMPMARDDYTRTYFDMIRESGDYVLARKAVERADMLVSEGARGIVLDGIRTINEMSHYRENIPGFYGLGIVVDNDIMTSRRIRFERMSESERNDIAKMTLEEFLERDEIEWGANHDFYSVKKCLEMCDEVLLNDSNREILEGKTKELITARFTFPA